MCGGRRRMRSRSLGGVSPVRTQRADLHVGQALRAQGLADAGQRRFQIALDVVRQRLERRDIDDLGFVLEPAIEALPHQTVDGGEKRRERLARSGRRGDQHMPARLDRRPSLRLRRRGRGEAAVKPRGDRGMKQRIWRHGTSRGRMIGHTPTTRARGVVRDIWVPRRLNQSAGTAGSLPRSALNPRGITSLPAS